MNFGWIWCECARSDDVFNTESIQTDEFSDFCWNEIGGQSGSGRSSIVWPISMKKESINYLNALEAEWVFAGFINFGRLRPSWRFQAVTLINSEVWTFVLRSEKRLPESVVYCLRPFSVETKTFHRFVGAFGESNCAVCVAPSLHRNDRFVIEHHLSCSIDGSHWPHEWFSFQMKKERKKKNEPNQNHINDGWLVHGGSVEPSMLSLISKPKKAIKTNTVRHRMISHCAQRNTCPEMWLFEPNR